MTTRTYSVALSAAPTRICTINPNRTSIQISGSDSTTAYVLFAQDVAYTEGFPVTKSQPFYSTDCKDELWGILASSTLTVSVIEVSGDG